MGAVKHQMKNMKTLEQYNEEKVNQFIENEKNKYRTWVLCDKCNTELLKTNTGIVLTSYPGKIEVHCPSCGYKGYMYV